MRQKAEAKKKREGKRLPETSQGCVDLSESESENNEGSSSNQEQKSLRVSLESALV